MATPPQDLAAWLTAHGFGASTLTICEALGGPRERLRTARADAFDLDDVTAPVLAAIEARRRPRPAARLGPARRPFRKRRPDHQAAGPGADAFGPRAPPRSAPLGSRRRVRLDLGRILPCRARCNATALEAAPTAPPISAPMPRASGSITGSPRSRGRPRGADRPARPRRRVRRRRRKRGAADRPVGPPRPRHAAGDERGHAGNRGAADPLARRAHGGQLLRAELSEAAPLGTMRGWQPARPVTQWVVTR